ncbi:DUF4349 domain-containing protein [Leucobacter sp. HY1910]
MNGKRFTMRAAAVALAFGLLASLVGCASGSSGSDSAGGAGLAFDGASSAQDESARNKLEVSPEATSDMEMDPGQHVISTAEVQLEAQHPDEAADEVTQAVTKLGGSVESRTVFRATGDTPASASLTVRVPPSQLEAAIATLSDVGEVLSQTSSAQDVTTQYVDLEARIKALDTSVKRLNDLMAGAATTSELIEAEGALTQRQQELDGLRAQFKALDEQVSESTIWVSITAPSVLPGGGPSNFWDGLMAGWASLIATGAGAVVVLGVLLPWLVVAGVAAIVVVAIVRSARRRRRRKQPSALGVGDQHGSVAVETAPGEERA